MAAQELTSSPPVNWSRFLDQTARDYETPPARGLTHGLQKEAIQNGWGARDGHKKWSYRFVLFPGSGRAPRLLTMTDAGTIGLVGTVTFNTSRLGENEPIPEEQRLARFEAMFESGDTALGPGLFGRGKLMFNAASKQKLILYDSLTRDGTYRFGIRHIEGRNYNQFPHVYEGDEAVAELKTRTHGRLAPLVASGTRITIVDPIDEVVSAVRDGSFLQAIEDSWWEIIQKHDADVTVQALPGKPERARLPKDFGGLPEAPARGWRVFHRENVRLPVEGHAFRVKKIHLLLPPAKATVRPDLLGLHIHRRGMVVGRINVSGMPGEIADRFFGYVFLDAELENALADQENTTHYGFTAPQRSPYRNLKQAVQTEFDRFLEELGLKKPDTSAEEKVRRLIEDAQADLNSILNGLGVPGFGAGRAAGADLQLSVEGLQFPGGLNQISVGDRIDNFQFRLKNTGRQVQKINWDVRTFDRDTGVIEVLLAKRSETVRPDREVRTSALSIRVKVPPYTKHSKVGCVCEVTDADGKSLAKRTFHFFIDLEPDLPDQLAEVRLVTADWPRQDSRRVDYGQSIDNVIYDIENRSPLPMDLRLRVRTLWAAESNSPIQEVHGESVSLTPYQSKTITVPRVEVTEGQYQDVGRGKVNLRCHGAALDTTRQWRKGDRLAENTVSFFLNMDPAYGFWEDTVFHQGGPAEPRSEPRPVDTANRTWKLSVNETHPAYVRTEDDEILRKDYLFEEMARQTIYVLLQMNHDEPVAKLAELAGGQKIDDLTPAEVIERIAYKIVDKVLAAYYSS